MTTKKYGAQKEANFAQYKDNAVEAFKNNKGTIQQIAQRYSISPIQFREYLNEIGVSTDRASMKQVQIQQKCEAAMKAYHSSDLYFTQAAIQYGIAFETLKRYCLNNKIPFTIEKKSKNFNPTFGKRCTNAMSQSLE